MSSTGPQWPVENSNATNPPSHKRGSRRLSEAYYAAQVLHNPRLYCRTDPSLVEALQKKNQDLAGEAQQAAAVDGSQAASV